MLLSNLWVKKKLLRKMRKYFELNENENTTHKKLWDADKVVLRGGNCSNKCLHLKRRQFLNRNLCFHLKKLEKRQQNKYKARRKKKKITAEISDIENSKTIRKINKPRASYLKR